MIISKEKLNFLNLYLLGADAKSDTGSLLQIITNKDKKEAIFFMLNNEVNLITTIENIEDIGEEDCFVFPINQFVSILQNLPSNCNIIFKDNSIVVGSSIKYSFEKKQNFVVQKQDVEFFLNEIDEKEFNLIKLESIQNILKLKSYIGNDDKLSTVVLMNKNFVVSNGIITIIDSSENIYDKNIYFSKRFAEFVSIMKNKNSLLVSLKDEEDNQFYYFNYDNTFCIFPFRKDYYIIPDLFTEELKQIYEHKYKCIVNKKELIEAIKRISIITKNNEDFRTFFTFDRDDLTIENREGNYALEKIQVEYCDEELFKFDIVLSSYMIKNILFLIEEEKCIFYVLPNKEEARVVTIKGEKEKDIFIHNLFRY